MILIAIYCTGYKTGFLALKTGLIFHRFATIMLTEIALIKNYIYNKNFDRTISFYLFQFEFS